MAESHHLERLKAYVLPLSRAKDFRLAKLEWRLISVEIHDHTDHCPCGQVIKELCFIQNIETNHRIYVGNVCVNNFLGIDTGNIFSGLRRLIEDPDASPNEDLIKYAYDQGLIYGDKEFKFLMDIRRKRKLSPAQAEWKRKINRRITQHVQVAEKRNNLKTNHIPSQMKK